MVGSAEQGFLYLYLKSFLPHGKFQAITPCFRDEVFDFTHTKYFMKNELIITDSVNKSSLNKMIDIAYNFYKNEGAKNLSVVETKHGFDINSGDVELGSYGIRSSDFLEWIYGTALAEPRFSMIINKQ